VFLWKALLASNAHYMVLTAAVSGVLKHTPFEGESKSIYYGYLKLPQKAFQK